LGHKPIEAFFDIGPETPDALIGDALRLQQILLNLTSNAVKFTSTGEVVISVRCLKHMDAAQEARVTLQFFVRDTGVGISAEQLGPIFDGFTQADASTSRMYGGSGLGLAISARLAALMSGQVAVSSTLGRGSEFRLEVPMTLGRSAPQAAPEGMPSALSILIVDDHPLARDVLTRTCAAFGWQATAVDGGAAGLKELCRSGAEGSDYDLLLLDWHMPGMNGLEMLRQAYATPGIGLPLVVLMAPIFELEQAVAASDDIELDGIVTKPMLPSSLLEAVTRAYSGDYASTLPLAGKSDRRLAGMRLLVAEDNQLNREVVEQILTRAGAEVVLVADGVAAVAALRQDDAHFDAVLMDIQMPLLDGYGATRIIREELGLLDLPIIAVTAFAQPQDLEKTRLAGMVGHVVKPLDVEDLLDLLLAERRAVAVRSLKSQTVAAQNAPIAVVLIGLDIAAGLKVFGGNATKYTDILRMFELQHGGDVDEAHRLYGIDNPQDAMRLLHGLGGVASLLQANGLARLAILAETAMRDGKAEVVPVFFDELQAAMHSVKQSILQFKTSGAELNAILVD
jgi:CheY-like chemotaxis protein